MARGSNVRLMCNSKRVNKWDLNGKKLPINARISGHFNHVLEIKNVRRHNEGAYNCHYVKNMNKHYKSAAVLMLKTSNVHYCDMI